MQGNRLLRPNGVWGKGESQCKPYPLWYGANVFSLARTKSVGMNDPAIIERLRALKREALEIKATNRVYQARSTHTKPEMELHERQWMRLQEIKKEIRAGARGPTS
jgi:hypothetical protein